MVCLHSMESRDRGPAFYGRNRVHFAKCVYGTLLMHIVTERHGCVVHCTMTGVV